MSLDSLVMDRDVDLETLEEIDYHKNDDSDQNIVQVGQTLSKETLSDSVEFVGLVFEVRKEGYKCTNVFISIFNKRERFP